LLKIYCNGRQAQQAQCPALAKSSSRSAAATRQQASKHRNRSNRSSNRQKCDQYVNQGCIQASWHSALSSRGRSALITHQAAVECYSCTQPITVKNAEYIPYALIIYQQ
jgi:Fe-S-cluster-containing hydrogenase component 2